MTCNECIRITFTGLRKTRHASELTQTLKIRLASCQHLMDIRLMANIKNQAVFIRVINGLKGYGQLNGTQIRGQMPAGFGYPIDQKRSDLLAKQQTFFIAQAQQILVTVDIL